MKDEPCRDHGQSVVTTFRNNVGIKEHLRVQSASQMVCLTRGRLFRHSTPNKERELEETGLESFA